MTMNPCHEHRKAGSCLRHSCTCHLLGRAVDRLYRKQPFDTDKDRRELLFTRYQELVDV